jgi:putative FmdB family regulatory protein
MTDGNLEWIDRVLEVAMPTYQYRCEKCGKVFERAEHVADHANAHPSCPDCKGTAVQHFPTTFIAKTSRKS